MVAHSFEHSDVPAVGGDAGAAVDAHFAHRAYKSDTLRVAFIMLPRLQAEQHLFFAAIFDIRSDSLCTPFALIGLFFRVSAGLKIMLMYMA